MIICVLVRDTYFGERLGARYFVAVPRVGDAMELDGKAYEVVQVWWSPETDSNPLEAPPPLLVVAESP